MKMTPADMRRMIVSKYNDPVNVKEAHRIDLISTTPYVIVTDQADNALDVEFPSARKVYTVAAVSDYVAYKLRPQRPELHRRQDYREDAGLRQAEEDSPGSTTTPRRGCGGSRPADGTVCVRRNSGL